MVTQHKRVFERLMAGETLAQIRRDTSSASAQQKGIQRYIEEQKKAIPVFQGEIRDLERKRKELKDDLQRLTSDVKDAESSPIRGQGRRRQAAGI